MQIEKMRTKIIIWGTGKNLQIVNCKEDIGLL